VSIFFRIHHGHMIVLRGVVGRSPLHRNDVFVSLLPTAHSTLLFFPGDIQAERRVMDRGPYPQYAEHYSYEATLDSLANSFPGTNRLLIRPAYQLPEGQSVYANLLSATDPIGALLTDPVTGVEALTTRTHLAPLLSCIQAHLRTDQGLDLPQLPLILVGFSKGCLVLNHLLLEEAHVPCSSATEADDGLFALGLIRRMVWVDAGNSKLPGAYPGPWPDLVHRFLQRLDDARGTAGDDPVRFDIHTTPFMVQLRPWLRQELEQFCQTLRTGAHAGFQSACHPHYHGETPSLDAHFKVLWHIH